MEIFVSIFIIRIYFVLTVFYFLAINFKLRDSQQFDPFLRFLVDARHQVHFDFRYGLLGCNLLFCKFLIILDSSEKSINRSLIVNVINFHSQSCILINGIIHITQSSPLSELTGSFDEQLTFSLQTMFATLVNKDRLRSFVHHLAIRPFYFKEAGTSVFYLRIW